ncbi:S8 family serine peptidase [Massilia agilis]|uniref:S8 family serine peptidase n=1 Tax=Massilia agilis TaxID=1811226 RepID=A0ABT2D8R3_9BURK|nr:S8 family serine peptidase [Massilia agilis]MCS0806838.1 S8 family serine peptidase [Massilia agilis]
MPKEPTSGQGAQPGQGAAPQNPQGAGAPPESGTAASRQPRGHVVGERKKRFLVAPRQPMVQMGPLGMLPMAFQPLSLSTVEQALRAAPDIEVVGLVGDRRAASPLAEGMGGGHAEGVLVARMTDQKAQDLHLQGQGRLLVERDQHLQLFEPALRQPNLVASLTPTAGPAMSLAVLVLDGSGAPVPEAEVSLFGSLLPASGVTGQDGTATITMYGENPHTVRGLYVKPKSDFWSLYQRDPDLSATEPNVVTLRPLSAWRGLSGFPGQNTIGWGQRAMRMDKLPPEFRGRGVRIAVIDSGVATSHTNLRQIGVGFDIIDKDTDPGAWNQDQLGHGSHCSGVIGGADPTFGIRGFAPEAEIHVCKLFPGGQVSQLIEALEYCIEHQIDVANLSLGGTEPSEALEQQILRAKRFGVACIAAAGNSGDAVQYPASSPHVLAVAAIGKAGEFPPDSYHSQTMNGDVDADGFFTARFSCYGPRVDVCAPGVAIVSSVPPNNFAAWDGTSMAAPHVTGLAALVLAHHPAFQGPGRAPNADRVERLFQVIRMSARRVTLGEQTRIGYGLPDALVALGWSVMAADRRGQQSLQGMAGMGLGALGGIGGVGLMGEAAFGQPVGLGAAQGGIPGIPGLPFGIGTVRGGW